MTENEKQRNLIARAIENGISKHRYSVAEDAAGPVPVWVVVKGLFCHGSTASAEICREYGFDPDQEIR
jgi:hypothetical protein